MLDLILIGDWLLDLQSGELTNAHDHNRKKYLTAKPLLFVRTLVAGKGDVVAKSAIVEQVWGGFTSPENVTQVINKLRVVFEDRDKKYFVNHPSIGYSLEFTEQVELRHDPNEVMLTGGFQEQATIDTNKTPALLARVPMKISLSKIVAHSGVFAALFTLIVVIYFETTSYNLKESLSHVEHKTTIDICSFKCTQDGSNARLLCNE